jgi:hypothetical protein
VGEDGQHLETPMLIVFGQVTFMDTVVSHRRDLGGVTHERQLDKLGQHVTARRIAMHRKRYVGQAIANGVKGSRRRRHWLGQRVALDTTLRGLGHIIAPLGLRDRQRMIGRHPGRGCQGNRLRTDRARGRGERSKRNEMTNRHELLLNKFRAEQLDGPG